MRTIRWVVLIFERKGERLLREHVVCDRHLPAIRQLLGRDSGDPLSQSIAIPKGAENYFQKIVGHPFDPDNEEYFFEAQTVE